MTSATSVNPSSRTMVFLGVAAASAVIAAGAWYGSRPAAVAGFADVGSQFFPDFTDPLKATALRVGKFDDKTRSAQSFEVRQDDKNQWVIPSHHNYPAEATDRLARTAASVIGIKKTAVQSRSKDDWKNYGVVDPAAEGSATLEERGTRITLSDGSSNSLVDLIIGKQVQGQEKHYYVREPEKDTTYIAEVDVNLSAKFSDWIEPDLLKVNQSELVSIVVDNYSIDEQQGALVQGETLKFAKDQMKSTNPWKLEGLDDAAEKLEEAPVRDIASNLDQLKIVGIRPKPEGLNADLTVSPDVARNPLVREVLRSDMQRQGFFIASGPNDSVRLVSNEGELVAGAENGVKYTLYFGEIARGSEKDIEVGDFAKGETKKDDKTEGEKKSDEATPADTKADADNKTDDESGGPRRYLLVKVEFDESFLGPEPVAPVAPVKPAILEEPAKDAAPADGTKPVTDGSAKTEDVPKEAATPPSASPPPTEQKTEAASPAEPKPVDPAPSEAPKPDAGNGELPKADAPAPEPAKPEPAKEETPAPETKPDSGECDPQEPAPAQEQPAAETPRPETPTEEPAKSGEPASAATPSASDEKSPAPVPASEQPATAAQDANKAPADAKPAEESKPAAETKPTEETKPADETKPAESSKPVTDSQPADAAATTPANTSPAAPAIPVDLKKEAEDAFKKAQGEYESAKAAHDRAVKERQDKIDAGKKKAAELSKRFGKWYYVITATSFEKLKIARKDVVSLKAADADKPADGSAIPAIQEATP